MLCALPSWTPRGRSPPAHGTAIVLRDNRMEEECASDVGRRAERSIADMRRLDDPVGCKMFWTTTVGAGHRISARGWQNQLLALKSIFVFRCR